MRGACIQIPWTFAVLQQELHDFGKAATGSQVECIVPFLSHTQIS
jgi:hypothetical protein